MVYGAASILGDTKNGGSMTSTKQHILDAAVSIMSRKGKDATVAEIAAAAKVTDSVLYHHFKNKEDLLFYSAGEYLKTGIQELQHHLQEVNDPVSRLGRFIWFQLDYHDANPRYAYVTIFECRSKKNFFHHEGFEPFRQWTRILREIFVDGIHEGLFPKYLNTFVFRDMVLGLLDVENIMFFTSRPGEKAQTDLDGILDLLLPILAVKPQVRNDKRHRLLIAAEAMFAQKGYDKATISEISGQAGVAEGTVYEYFKNKEDLLHSVFQYRFQEHLASMDELFAVKTPLRKLKRFIQYHFSIYLNQPEFAKTFILNGIFNRRFYQTPAYADFQKYLDSLDPILEEGKRRGHFRSSIDNRIFKNLFIGAFSHMALRWLFAGQSARIDKTSEIHDVIELLARSVSVQDSG
ncbi:MAG: TetR family transcriptional regulator [Desulfobacteraceae bacterium]|nr:MAG: TetR family transcriptional regulator [Desulfobacteraceae bacterium]